MGRKNQKAQAASSRQAVNTMVEDRPTPSLKTLEVLLDELQDAMHEMERLREKLDRHDRGSQAYLNLLPDILVSASVLEAKSNSLWDEAQAIIQATPEG